jgi:4-azaleucine resistance transporter AzlC
LAAAANTCRASPPASPPTPIARPNSISRHDFFGGARAGLPVVLGYLGIGLAAGVVERAAGMSYAEVLLISTVLYAGSAQFVVTSLLTLASPAAAIVLTVFFLNLRHLLLSAALAPALRHVPAWKNALIGLQLTDETFVIAAGKPALSPAWMAGLNLAAWTTWAAANLAGAALSGSVGDTRVLAFALPCMFAGLLVLQIHSFAALRTPVCVAVFSGAFALLAQIKFAGPAVIIVATMAGATLGLVLHRWTART